MIFGLDVMQVIFGGLQKSIIENSTDGTQSSNRHFVQFGINLKLI